MAQVEEASHSGKSGWASRGGCWRCGQVPNVGLKPVLKEKGPSRQFKWLSVGSDLPVLSKMQGFFPWILKDQSGQVMSLLTPLNHIYILSPSHSHSSSFGYSQNPEAAEGFQCWRGGWGEKVLVLCVVGRKRLTLGHMLQGSAR